MAKWIGEATLLHADPRTEKPKYIEEKFVGDSAAKRFAVRMTNNGYSVTVRTHDGVDSPIKMTGAALIKWMRSKS